MNKDKITIDRCLKYFPLRIALTDYCNLQCFFCSNEGMALSERNKNHVDGDKLKYLIEALTEKGLRNVSITGGEPSLYKDIFNLIQFLAKFNFKDLFFHTNGIGLDGKLREKLLSNFTKVGVSIHTTEFHTWQGMTGGTKKQFLKIFDNLKETSDQPRQSLIEVKCVPIKGYNDSENQLKRMLEFCNKFGFKFKLLNFEPIVSNHLKLRVPFPVIKRRLINVGCNFQNHKNQFRAQDSYLPLKSFEYKDIEGVAIEIGCGDEKVCNSCYNSNEIFITPTLKIKPCHVSNWTIDLNHLIEKQNIKGICRAIVQSRLFLKKAPGLGRELWR